MRIGFPGTETVVHDPWPEFARTEHELPREPDTMDKNTADLAYRQGAGIEVALLWHRRTGELISSGVDRLPERAGDTPDRSEIFQ